MKALIHYAYSNSPIGWLFIGKTEQGLCSIILGEAPTMAQHTLIKQFPNHLCEHAPNDLSPYLKQIKDKIVSPHIPLDVALDIQGTLFQKKVWHALCQSQVGSTISYKTLAQHIGLPNAARAVANACNANKLAILIPCHRVIRSNGDLSGYRWGTKIKQQLIEYEALKLITR